MKDDSRIVEDVQWHEIETKKDGLGGKIKFRKKKDNYIFVKICKGVIFVLIAALSGGITGGYISSKKYSSAIESNNSSFFQSNKASTGVNNASQNPITRVAETVSQSVVGINNSNDNILDGENNYSGSGIIFKSDGYIVTNYHVIKGTSKHLVKLSNGKNSKPFNAKVIGYDSMSDLAVIKIDAPNLPAAVFGDSSKVQVGDTAIAIGNPLGDEFSGSVTAGIISAVNRNIGIQDPSTGVTTTYNLLQTDAAINPGNSGGALCNESGEVIGINSLKIGADENVEGMGFAISINEAKNIINSIMKNGRVIRPDLGIINPEDYVSEDKKTKGVFVKQVKDDAGAQESGIKANDIIVEFDSVKIQSKNELQDIVNRHKVGDSVPCKVIRNGKIIRFNIKIK
ncbi:S1C family serine protease [Clostridium pasteurianum]|uniref:Trypsin-like serine protease with C-terminal PDZ domain n=1 Tax=Clostridium pasteurianum BC1 TaxID=86416 RepID=R4K7X1_CLOPA|nr:trypsin-like peptidase domain-containing protein [Clostridium pasteurianum]AGK99282.1 trypsin-like serine protease with C-terminal PDZ domain [Clostridium pasteurianum BC1]